jgi:4-amino-4-deoxy-L-arabinose transferase-like glycosyltransferase/membrane-associated phospholipid phosphatase
LDVGLLRFINQTLSNRVFDVVMPFVSGNKLFFPALILAGLVFLCKGGPRARLCALMMVLILWPGDSFVCNTLKHAISRPRPYVTFPEVNVPGRKLKAEAPAAAALTKMEVKTGGPNYNSMPSSHAANWFAATMILLVYYRKSWRFMLPLACLVAFSRVYNGLHYPSDVLAGAILGAGYAAAGLWGLNTLWQTAGRKWFPLWYQQLPSLTAFDNRAAQIQNPESRIENPDAHWLHLGYLIIAVLCLVQLIYLASGSIELSEDEAYQWVWSKHPALSYFSKPPMIAYAQWLGTHLWGDTELGVRFFSPMIGAVLSLLVLRFFAREINAQTGFWLIVVFAATPMLALGGTLMTVDPLSVLFWTAAMLSGWRAVQPEAGVRPWVWTGLWLALGFLSKFTEIFQLVCFALFFVLWKPVRAQLRKPGLYLALLINLAGTVPVLWWNHQNGWPTVEHLKFNAGMTKEWHFTFGFFIDFVVQEVALLNPFFIVAAFWAAIAFWRHYRKDARLLYFFSMGMPLFVGYWLFTFHSRVQPNWIAPSIVPLLCVAAIYWDHRRRETAQARRGLKLALTTGLVVGFCFVILMHDTELIQHVTGRPLPPKPDPMTRVRGYKEMTAAVEQLRQKFMAEEGKPVFIIGAHYGTTSLVTFYLPEARTNVLGTPLAYYLRTGRPENQFYFWPTYTPARQGQNALYVREVPSPPLARGWIGKWLKGEKYENLLRSPPEPLSAPRMLYHDFESVTDLGLVDVLYHGRVFHTLQIFECRDLK